MTAESIRDRAQFAVDNPGCLHSPQQHRELIAELLAENARLDADNKRLDALINTPETRDFLDGVKREAAHQLDRWGRPHDRSKSAENWYWLIGYLAGKALRAAISGDKVKARHHTISTAAALMHWHTAILADETGAGIGRDDDLKEAV